jgi:hypothetical protein
MSPIMLSEAELARREPVWLAFSDLWLDMEKEDWDIQSIARVAIQSGYTLDELRDIYLYEIAPVVYRNLRTPVGVWGGFDEEWLFTQAKRRAEHRSLWLRTLLSTGLGKYYLTHDTENYWQQIVAIVSAVRN